MNPSPSSRPGFLQAFCVTASGLKQRALRALAFAAIYFVAARASTIFAVTPSRFSALWLPSGLLLGVLLRTARREWPELLLSALLAGISANFGVPLWQSASYVSANLVDAVIGALLIQRFGGLEVRLDTLRQVFLFALIPGLVSTPIGATLGALAHVGGGGELTFWPAWRIWWASANLGVLTLTPAILTAGGPGARVEARRQGGERLALFEIAGLLLGITLVCLVVFARPAGVRAGPPLVWVLFPAFVWLGWRYNLVAVSIGALILNTIAVFATAHGHGPFALGAASVAGRVVTAEFYLGVTVYAALMLVAAQLESRRAVQALQEDIQAREEAEAENALLQCQIQRAHRLEAVGTLAGGIAHDFNNILAALLGNVHIIRMDLPPDHRLRPHVEETLRAGERATELVKQILAFSRQQRTEELVPTDLVPLIKEVVKLVRAVIPSTIEIVTDIEPSVPHVRANAGQIHQVLMNLVTNASHAMRESGGTMTIALGSVASAAAGQTVRLAVSDTGTGMSPAVVERIFDPFFTTKAPGEGSGLGLAVVHGIVDRHEGRMSVQSEEGRGSTFEVLLPPAPAAARRLSGPRVVPAQGRGQHVMVVDDEPGVVRVADILLTDMGYTVSGFADGESALAAFRKAPARFGAVITDLTMPRMTGLTLSRELRRLRPEVPVFLTTGFRGLLSSDQLANAGVRDVLAKPFSPADLSQVMRVAFGS